MLLCSGEVSVLFIQKLPSDSDKNLFEVNCNKLALYCCVLHWDRAELNHIKLAASNIWGALYYGVCIRVHIESVTEGDVRSARRELACCPKSYPDIWMLLMKMKTFPVALFLQNSSQISFFSNRKESHSNYKWVHLSSASLTLNIIIKITINYYNFLLHYDL